MQRVNVDLTTARTIPVAFQFANAKRLRFHVVPQGAAIEARIQQQNSDAIPINEPFTLENCGPNPWTKVWITNVASAGSLVIISTDGTEDFDDFLASGSALATTQSFLLTESVISHSFWNPNIASPQEAIGNPATAATPVVSAGGLAGQNFNTVLPYYGGITASVLASAVALNGGSIVWGTRPLNVGSILNAMQTTAFTFTQNQVARNAAGLWYLRTDWFLETPTIGVPALDMVAAVGLGFEPATTTAANGLSGCRGAAIIWSNDRGNDNFWIVAADGGAVLTQSLDLGISALGHHLVEFQWGIVGGVGQINAVIDGQPRGQITSLGMSMATLSAMAASVWLPRVAAFKIQAAQAGNQVTFRHSGYAGYALGRLA